MNPISNVAITTVITLLIMVLIVSVLILIYQLYMLLGPGWFAITVFSVGGFVAIFKEVHTTRKR